MVLLLSQHKQLISVLYVVLDVQLVTIMLIHVIVVYQAIIKI